MDHKDMTSIRSIFDPLPLAHFAIEKSSCNHLPCGRHMCGSSLLSVCLWDIYTGALLHRFGSHAGEITRLYVPPPGCTPRVQHCVCGIASDNSVSLLSLKVLYIFTPSVVLPLTISTYEMRFTLATIHNLECS